MGSWRQYSRLTMSGFKLEIISFLFLKFFLKIKSTCLNDIHLRIPSPNKQRWIRSSSWMIRYRFKNIQKANWLIVIQTIPGYKYFQKLMEFQWIFAWIYSTWRSCWTTNSHHIYESIWWQCRLMNWLPHLVTKVPRTGFRTVMTLCIFLIIKYNPQHFALVKYNKLHQ